MNYCYVTQNAISPPYYLVDSKQIIHTSKQYQKRGLYWFHVNLHRRTFVISLCVRNLYFCSAYYFLSSQFNHMFNIYMFAIRFSFEIKPINYSLCILWYTAFNRIHRIIIYLILCLHKACMKASTISYLYFLVIVSSGLTLCFINFDLYQVITKFPVLFALYWKYPFCTFPILFSFNGIIYSSRYSKKIK